jgi:hypothetical protein
MSEIKAQRELSGFNKWSKEINQNNTLQTFELVPFAKKAVSQDYLNTIKQDLFKNMPFMKDFF